MKPPIPLFLLLLSSLVHAQPLSILKDIGQGPPNTQTGLSQVFNGRLLNDGNVYFLGSHDGFTRHLWRTDGTPDGTFLSEIPAN